VQVLGQDDYISIKPPINGQSRFFGNSFNIAKSPPKIISFPADFPVKICFKTGQIVDGHPGFRAEMSETAKTDWISSPNYPEHITNENFLDPPRQSYGPGISKCWVRSPSIGSSLELEFFQFDVSCL
jgi:hypothetical protein